MKRSRRNPFDVSSLIEARAPLSVVVALQELDAAGVPIERYGDLLIVDIKAATTARMGDIARTAADRSGGAVIVLDPSTLRGDSKEILDALARTFFVMGWDAHHGSTSRDPFEDAPRTSSAAKKFAVAYVQKFEKANGLPVGVLYQLAARAPGKHYHKPTPGSFGHYVAMQAMGHGVAWSDDHPDIGMKVPHGEYYY